MMTIAVALAAGIALVAALSRPRKSGHPLGQLMADAERDLAVERARTKNG